MDKLLSTAGAQQRPRFKLGACRRCGGDAFFDPADAGEWRCLQCARPLSSDTGGYSQDHAISLVNGRLTARVFAP